MSGRITLKLRFHPLARRPDVPRIGRRWDVVVVVDGVEHVFSEGPKHELNVAPGHHEVEVFFRAAGIMFVARVLGLRYGRKSLQVEVPSEGELTLEYAGGMFWTFGGGTLRVAP